MVFYIVYSLEHIDNIRRSQSKSNIEKIYKNKEKAYEYALRKQLSYIDLLDLTFDVKNNGKEIFLYLTNDEKSFHERLNYFHNNFQKIFGKPKFSAQPSCICIYVKEFHEFSDDTFIEDLNELKEITE